MWVARLTPIRTYKMLFGLPPQEVLSTVRLVPIQRFLHSSSDLAIGAIRSRFSGSSFHSHTSFVSMKHPTGNKSVFMTVLS